MLWIQGHDKAQERLLRKEKIRETHLIGRFPPPPKTRASPASSVYESSLVRLALNALRLQGVEDAKFGGITEDSRNPWISAILLSASVRTGDSEARTPVVTYIDETKASDQPFCINTRAICTFEIVSRIMVQVPSFPEA
ncbi:Uncharacterized protein Rs2_30145 [Raphanus sativus]|nr:Uncharacterized protein Rs2_30145 [Raphanus sativus]